MSFWWLWWRRLRLRLRRLTSGCLLVVGLVLEKVLVGKHLKEKIPSILHRYSLPSNPTPINSFSIFSRSADNLERIERSGNTLPWPLMLNFFRDKFVLQLYQGEWWSSAWGGRNRNPTSSWPRVVRRAGAAAVLVEAAGKSERWQCQSCMQSLATTLLLPSHRRDILTWNGIDTLRVQCPDLCAFFLAERGAFWPRGA